MRRFIVFPKFWKKVSMFMDNIIPEKTKRKTLTVSCLIAVVIVIVIVIVIAIFIGIGIGNHSVFLVQFGINLQE